MVNGVMLQYFDWYYPAGGVLWKNLTAEAKTLQDKGFTAIWIPPAGKGSGGNNDCGYTVYDLFDLGEFNQKGTVATKYGTKAELMGAIQTLQTEGIQVYADVVFNHKDGGDEVELVWVREVDKSNRNRPISDWYEVLVWTYFKFPGRGTTYSSMQWHWWCFDMISWVVDKSDAIFEDGRYSIPDKKGREGVFQLKNKFYETEVSSQYGNFDHLMACDLDTREWILHDPDGFNGELRYWGRWIVDTLNVDGFRLDAVKHIRATFFREWIQHLRTHFGGKQLFALGEYWSGSIAELHQYISKTAGTMSLFDVPLHFNFFNASRAGSTYDLRTIFERTLVQEQPALAVTFVDNHDTQPCQSLESWVEPWFKPLAYALILLRKDGYPCVFLGDYRDQSSYQDKGREVTLYSHRFLIDKFIWARQAYGFGEQQDYFDHPRTIGWTRLGNSDHPGSMAVVLTNGTQGYKWMNMFRKNTEYRDQTGHFTHHIWTNDQGWGAFPCPAQSVSVWIQV